MLQNISHLPLEDYQPRLRGSDRSVAEVFNNLFAVAIGATENDTKLPPPFVFS